MIRLIELFKILVMITFFFLFKQRVHSPFAYLSSKIGNCEGVQNLSGKNIIPFTSDEMPFKAKINPATARSVLCHTLSNEILNDPTTQVKSGLLALWFYLHPK